MGCVRSVGRGPFMSRPTHRKEKFRHGRNANGEGDLFTQKKQSRGSLRVAETRVSVFTGLSTVPACLSVKGISRVLFHKEDLALTTHARKTNTAVHGQEVMMRYRLSSLCPFRLSVVCVGVLLLTVRETS